MRRPRMRLRTLMLMVAVLALVCAIAPTVWLLFPSFRSRSGGAAKEVPLSIRVVDQVTGKSIAGAKVQLQQPVRPDLFPSCHGVTGHDGRVVLAAVAAASGTWVTAEVEAAYRLTLWKTERVSLSGGSVTAEAQGYQAARVPLTETSHRATFTIPLRPL
jgi:hypothetical protein